MHSHIIHSHAHIHNSMHNIHTCKHTDMHICTHTQDLVLIHALTNALYIMRTHTHTHTHNIQTHRPTHTHTHKYSHNYRSCISTCMHSHKCRYKKNTHMCLHIITRDTCTPVVTHPDMPTDMWVHRGKGEMHTKTHNHTGLGVSKYSKRE